MAMTTLFEMPGWDISTIVNETVMNAENEAAALLGSWATADGASASITHVCFGVSRYTTTGDVTAQIESVDASTGLPNGIIAAGRSGVVSVTATGWYEAELSTAYTLTSGAWLACTATIDATGSIRIMQGTRGGSGVWWAQDVDGAGWVKVQNMAGAFAMKTSGGLYIFPGRAGMQYSWSTQNVNTGSNPRYVGNRITCGISRRLRGFRMPRLDMDYDISVALVDVDGNVLKGDDSSTDMKLTMDSEYRSTTGAGTDDRLEFPCPKTLSASTNYYLIFSPESASSTVIGYGLWGSETLMKQNMQVPPDMTIRRISSPSAWSITESATDMTALMPVFDQIEMSSGGGASPRFGDMTGGLR